jgi:hypothetical protein
MQNKKNFPTDFGPWTFLGAEIEDVIREGTGPDVHSSHIVACLIAAIEPKTLDVAMRDPLARPLADCFIAGMATNPDLILRVLQTVRNRWHNPNPPVSEIVRKFMASNPWVPIPMQNGKVKLVILTKEISDDDISRALKCTGPGNIETSTVKSARQDWRFPKRNISYTDELHAALKRLRLLHFCRYW